MKKVILSAVMLIGLAFSAEAQEVSKNALGLRLGDSDGFGGELSYQRRLSGDNRLELDLGWRNNDHYDAYKLVGVYQWFWNIDQGFYWYAGVGGGIGSYSINRYPGYDGNDSGTFLVAAGDIGIEYNFDIPLQVSLDIRPELYFGDDFRDDNFGPDIALGLRYRF
ncbi:MAG: hypothetical protein CFE23_11005 [Flavobacterium sp. BFFFF1]|uniref:hypothetical protein n=1 Tax=unclassified Flavobacterium TaxID=196869 RepID=UPI000BCC0683|nr:MULTISPECIES: hypothetical protein [unclassified Flavobacterium]OYU80064.1 MAG: hypothetical protein CFE23_11005 [Flavobacterium sp. BFFFF1]